MNHTNPGLSKVFTNSSITSVRYFELNPLCPTNYGVKYTEHYSLLCHIYDANRLDILNSVNMIFLPHGLINLSNEKFLKIILYGHEQLSFDSNTKFSQQR